MENKKEFIIKIAIICIIIVISVCAILFYSKEDGDIMYENLLEENDFEENINFENSLSDTNENNIEKIKIYITGEVKNPGVKEVEEGARIEDVIKLANGLTEFANIANVNLAYEVEDGQKIYIPNINENIEEYVTTENGEGIVESNTKSLNRMNINKADLGELCELPGVGESLANRIIQYREENGKFKTVEDLKNVSGIGEKKFESLREYVVVK